MSEIPAANTVLFSAKDNVRLYVLAALNSHKSDEVFQSGQEIGITTGNSIRNSAGTWIEVNVVVGQKRNPWQLLIPVVGTILYATQRNGSEITNNFWLRAEDGDFQIVDTPESTALQAAADKAAVDAKRKQALIDAVGSSNPNLTANSGTSSSSSYVGWIVGGVLVFVAGLVIWKIASKPKAQAVVPQPQYVPRPRKLR